MRFIVLVILVEVALLGAMIHISRTRRHDEAVQAAAPAVQPVPRERPATRRPEMDVLAAALRSARNGLDRHLSAEEKAADLAPDLVDAILRMEGIYDPTRVRVFGRAMRMEVRPGTASMTNVFGDRWVRASADPNMHRHVAFVAQAWLAPRARGCDSFWMFRRTDAAVMLDGLTPGECRRLLAEMPNGPAVADAPVVAARLSLPAFAAPYPGNRLSHQELVAEQQARIRQMLADRWFGPEDATPIVGASRF